jgi:hemoglobin
MEEVKKDITSRDHIELLVNSFYEQVKTDPVLGPMFAHVHWPHHLPVMYRFWSSMLLGEQSYSGNPFEKHIPLPLQAAHFDRWLELFDQTTDQLFFGETATQAKDRARSIARVWQHKLLQIKSN